MKIQLTISTYALGDDNTDADNKRYAAAVQAELQSAYPGADVSIDLAANVTAVSCRVSDDPYGEIEGGVLLIASQVWDRADY